MTIDLLNGVPVTLAEKADLDALLAAVRAVDVWQDRHAEVLDYVYRFRLARLIANRAPADELRELNTHLGSVAHPRRQAQLDALSLPYFARWTAYRRILEDRLALLTSDVPRRLMERSHVKEILALAAQSGSVTQKEISERLDLGKANLTRILDLLEATDMVMRRRQGRENEISLTDLGRQLLPPQQEQKHHGHPFAFASLQNAANDSGSVTHLANQAASA